VVTCCEANAGYISSAVPAADRPPVSVVHHGVDLRRFAPVERRSTGDDRAPAITSIGRLVEKKGFDDLLRALALLATGGLRFTCRIYGDGPLLEPLTRLRDELDLAPCVEFMGARDSDEVVAALAHTDVFALTPRVTEDGDRDGIPNVLVEAMASAVPVVTTSVGGVPELVQDGVNGAMVPPGDPSLIAQGLATLLADPDLRARMGTSARATVEDDYDVNAAALRLAGIFGTRTAAVGVAP
jgi:glycosyltransferase involved in cell wall biosynthesis